MSNSSYDRVKEQIKDSIDIVELVSRFVSLGRSGRHYVGRCPWHEDSRPSLQVNPERQSFKCWVCNIGGDVFSFVMQYNKVDFKEAMEFLANLYGIELPKKRDFRPHQHDVLAAPSNQSADVDPNRLLQELAAEELLESEYGGLEAADLKKEKTKTATLDTASTDTVSIDKETLFKTLDWVQKQYHEALLTLDEAKGAREYLAERGIQERSIAKFGLGYAPMKRNWLLDKIDNSPQRIACLEAAGVFARSQANPSNVYDRFYGRLLFPILDELNRTIAFGGRLLPNSTLKSPAKYVNSPETALFIKSKQLYGLNVALTAMRVSNRALIMEGYTDCIMSHQVGLEDAVAILGTALGPDHIKILRRYVDKMVLVLDGDEAGQKRTNEVLELFVSEGIDLVVLTLPQGSDPCEFLLEQGKEKFEELLQAEGVDALDHAFRSVTRGIDLQKDIVASSKALDQLISLIASAPEKLRNLNDPLQLRIEKMIGLLSQKFYIADSEVRKRLKFWKDKKTQVKRYVPPGEDEQPQEISEPAEPVLVFPPDALERELLELWFADPNTFGELDNLIPDDWMISPLTVEIQKAWRKILDEEQQCSFSRLLVRFDDPNVKNLLVEIDESAAEKGLGPEMEKEKREDLMKEIVQGFTRRDLKRQNPRDISELKNGSLSKEEKQRKLQDILQRAREKHLGD